MEQNGKFTYSVTMRRVPATNVAVDKQLLRIPSACVALVIKHKMRMRHTVNRDLSR
jgi:hypothetical protein